MKGVGPMRVAYVRVSTVEQNEARQVEALQKYDIEKWYQEKVSGKDTKREQLQRMLDFVREGDEIYIMDFSRLSRSVSDLLAIVEMLNAKKVRLVSLKENLDTSTPTGKLMLTMIGAIAAFERENTLDRQREGIAIAKREGKYKGRRQKELDNFEEIYESWEKGEITAVAAAKALGINRGTFYNRVKKYKSEVEINGSKK
jgi:DNA invertase Pin-like site-specific DNA recombinase